jgi:hypothetical protein
MCLLQSEWIYVETANARSSASHLRLHTTEFLNNRASIGHSARRKPASAERPLSQFVAFNHPVKALAVYGNLHLPSKGDCATTPSKVSA